MKDFRKIKLNEFKMKIKMSKQLKKCKYLVLSTFHFLLQNNKESNDVVEINRSGKNGPVTRNKGKK